MTFTSIVPGKSISLFVKNILVFEEKDETQKTLLPFFADGYPGLMYQDTEHGLLVSPHNKQMPDFFLYGQTIQPIELVLNGSYTLIIYQLYPFVLKNFFNVTPKDINDDCYNLGFSENKEILNTIQQLKGIPGIPGKIKTIATLLYSIFRVKKASLDFTVRQAIQVILDNNGLFPIGKLPGIVNITPRTLERRFLNEVGVSPKQFSKMIQFQMSLKQLSVKDYSKLTDVVYSNGFADQSHFIKVFKAFTGKTPRLFRERWVN